MTIAELVRYMDSRKRMKLAEERRQAVFDYTLADTIGRSIGRFYSSTNSMPSIQKVYPSLFDDEELKEQEQARRMELSVIRFTQFAQAHNNKHKGATTQNE